VLRCKFCKIIHLRDFTQARLKVIDGPQDPRSTTICSSSTGCGGREAQGSAGVTMRVAQHTFAATGPAAAWDANAWRGRHQRLAPEPPRRVGWRHRTR